MATAYVFEIDGYVFPRADVPARGPIVEADPQRWSEQNPLGAYGPGSVLTFMGTTSQRWPFVSRAVTATKDKLVAVFNARLVVLFKTPQNTSGFNVLMTELDVQFDEPIEGGKFLCRFTLVKR